MARPRLALALRIPALATAAILALTAAAIINTSTFLILGLALGGLAVVWAAGIEDRRARVRGSAALGRAAAEAEAARAERDRERAAAAEILALMNALDEPILATDGGNGGHGRGEGGRIVRCNTSAAALLGMPRERIVGRPVQEIFTQEEMLRLHAEAAAGESRRAEVRVTRPGGVRTWEVSMSPVAGGAGAMRGVAIGLRDITDLARAMQVRSDFAANASHELRTPIAAMRVAMDTLGALDEGDASGRARFMGLLARNIARLEAMVRDLLDLARLESPEVATRRERFAAAGLEADLAPLYARVLRERSLVLRFEFDPALGELRTDRNLLLSILGNLIDNATKYAFEGTTITVSARPGPGGGVRFEVADKGVGIPLDQQQRIFERYYQVDAARSINSSDRGTGLGLSIVKHAVKRLGGSIRVESVWHQGTRMIVEIPGVIPPEGAAGGGA